MKIYVINLEGSVSRWAEIAGNLEELGADFTRVSAIYGRSLDWRALSDDRYCLSYMGRSLQPGEVGCYLSHLRALQEFVDSGAEHAIILEDDAHCSPHLLRAARWITQELAAAGYLAVNLGPSDYKYSTEVAIQDGCRLRCAHRFPMLATGIMWSRAGAIGFLKESGRVTLPYDSRLRQTLSGTNKVFSVEPPLVRARQTSSDIDAEGVAPGRSKFNRSPYYFFHKQRRIWCEKYRALLALIEFRRLRGRADPSKKSPSN